MSMNRSCNTICAFGWLVSLQIFFLTPTSTFVMMSMIVRLAPIELHCQSTYVKGVLLLCDWRKKKTHLCRHACFCCHPTHFVRNGAPHALLAPSCCGSRLGCLVVDIPRPACSIFKWAGNVSNRGCFVGRSRYSTAAMLKRHVSVFFLIYMQQLSFCNMGAVKLVALPSIRGCALMVWPRWFCYIMGGSAWSWELLHCTHVLSFIMYNLNEP